jgi:DNA (cytosine-5)-methyltransferase 1
MAFSTAWAPQQKGLILDLASRGRAVGRRGYAGSWVCTMWAWSGMRRRPGRAAAAKHTTIRVDVSCFVLGPVIGRVWGLIVPAVHEVLHRRERAGSEVHRASWPTGFVA